MSRTFRTREERIRIGAEVARMKGDGYTHREIASCLRISASQVHSYYQLFREDAERRKQEVIDSAPTALMKHLAARGNPHRRLPDDDSLTDVDPEKVTYIPERDVYLIKLRGDLGTQAFPGKLIRALRRAYSRAAGSPTLKEVAHAHGLTRNHLDAIRAAMGWTKNDLPVTDEELRSKSESEVIEDVLALKAQRIEVEVEKRLRAADVRDAKKWRDAMVSFGNDLREEALELMAGQDANQGPTLRQDGRMPGGDRAVVLGLSDWHFGMFADGRVSRSTYDLDVARRRLMEAWVFIRRRLPEGVTDIILPISGDLFHVDNEQGNTTRGTPQDVVNDVGLMARDFLRTMANFVNELANETDGYNVHLVPVHGNHDSLVGKMTMVSLAMVYEWHPRVAVHEAFTPNTMLTWRKNLLYFAHGDGLKSKDMPLYVAAEHPAEWGDCLSRVGFSGHIHHEVVKEFPGFKHYTMPSLAGTDRWHAKQGYSSQSGMMGYILEPGLGVTMQVFAPSRP